jgi:hypothetical protein
MQVEEELVDTLLDQLAQVAQEVVVQAAPMAQQE